MNRTWTVCRQYTRRTASAGGSGLPAAGASGRAGGLPGLTLIAEEDADASGSVCRVSTTRQAQAQGIEQQLDRLRAAAAERGWELDDQHVYRDDGYSGARMAGQGWTGSAITRRWPSWTWCW